jgi:hypothetical protein
VKVGRGKLVGSVPSHRVLVTGCPRGGTTFVGHALALPATVDYFHEPLNPKCGVDGVTDRFVDLSEPRWSDAAAGVRALVDYQPVLRGADFPDDTQFQRFVKRFVAGRGPARLAVARCNPWSRHVLVKDPFAALSVPWFARHGFQTIAVVRHPAALCSSYARIGWTGADAITELMAHRGSVDEAERRLVAAYHDQPEVLPAVLWRIVTRHLVQAEQRSAGDVVVVTHESISADPSRELARLRARVGLPWSAVAERRLRSMSGAGHEPAAGEGRTQRLRRRSSGIFAAALDRLDDDSIAQIWQISGELASRWYEPDRVRT